jgi:hypothetical protein
MSRGTCEVGAKPGSLSKVLLVREKLQHWHSNFMRDHRVAAHWHCGHAEVPAKFRVDCSFFFD